MAPLIVLVVVTGLARIIGWLSGLDWLNSWPHATQIGLALMFLLTASAHFQQPKRGYLIAMVPPRVPNAAAMVTLTGILELAGATGLLVPLTTKLAAGCLAALMLALFPANVRAAKAPGGIKTMPLPLRALVQLAFIGACALVIAG